MIRILSLSLLSLVLACCASPSTTESVKGDGALVHDEDGTKGIKTEPIPDDGEDRSHLTPEPTADPIQVTIFNRVLLKPKDQGMAPAALKAAIEDATGKKVETMRRTAVRFYLVVFEATTPPRTADDQQALIKKLQADGAFEIVEADRIMTIK